MEFVQIPAGKFLMGDSTHQGFAEDYEGPAVEKEVHAFEMAKTPVTNAEFLEFVQATGYQTLAERLGDSYVFHLLLSEEKRENYPHVTGSPWWKVVPNANWAHPFGEGSSIDGIEDHPVVHIALEDAITFCKWANLQLPTEVQWEYAARAMSTSTYPWGEDLVPASGYCANTWQGDFPNVNDALDGFVGTAPVYSFEPNDFGLYQMIGNVWEWCSHPRGIVLPLVEERIFLDSIKPSGEFAIRGGSFLCHCSYCNRYRVAARNGAFVTSTTSHMGFRCVRFEEESYVRSNL